MTYVIHHVAKGSSYSSCGIYPDRSSSDPEKVTCGNCRYTNAFAEARHKQATAPKFEDWQRAIPDEGFYWVSDGLEVDSAYSDGREWYTSSCYNYDFDAFEITYFKKMETPQPPKY